MGNVSGTYQGENVVQQNPVVSVFSEGNSIVDAASPEMVLWLGANFTNGAYLEGQMSQANATVFSKRSGRRDVSLAQSKQLEWVGSSVNSVVKSTQSFQSKDRAGYVHIGAHVNWEFISQPAPCELIVKYGNKNQCLARVLEQFLSLRFFGSRPPHRGHPKRKTDSFGVVLE